MLTRPAFRAPTWLLVFGLLVFSVPAHAYIDPGTGGVLLQLLLGAAFGALFYIKRIIAWFGGLFGKGKPQKTESSTDTKKAS